jgi:hypothetical protein
MRLQDGDVGHYGGKIVIVVGILVNIAEQLFACRGI